MNNNPLHQRPDLVSQAALDSLFTDAQNWRNLTAQLINRGFDDFGPGDIAAIVELFPNFRAMAAMADALPDDTDQQAAPTLQAPSDPFLDAFLTPTATTPTTTPPVRNHDLDEIEIQKITRLRSTLGPVTVGYTTDDQIAFAFERSRQLHTVRLTDLLADLIDHLTRRRTMAPMPTRPKRIM
jgi:hypothetical protein